MQRMCAPVLLCIGCGRGIITWGMCDRDLLGITMDRIAPRRLVSTAMTLMALAGALYGIVASPRVFAAVPSPTSIDFGGQSMGTTSPSQAVTYTNTGGV